MFLRNSDLSSSLGGVINLCDMNEKKGSQRRGDMHRKSFSLGFLDLMLLLCVKMGVQFSHYFLLMLLLATFLVTCIVIPERTSFSCVLMSPLIFPVTSPILFARFFLLNENEMNGGMMK